ncbi:MAG: PhoH family protein [Clostridia bacterium]|nr:PhoH family protein [Clostridia bacterium]
MLEQTFSVTLVHRTADDGEVLVLSGDEEQALLAEKALLYMRQAAEKADELEEQTVRYIMDTITAGQGKELEHFADDCIAVTIKGKPIKAKTVGQKRYVDAIGQKTIVFGIGPAGTGKTFLAVSMAVKALREHKVSRILLTRPAIEAGEKLGFLPGDLQSKIDPYLRPLYDALYEMLGVETYQKYVEKGIIEIAPLAYMRGRTLDDSFIILDEAQNATPQQMKMFLTRLGFNSKMVITGDLTQTDLPDGQKSGLLVATRILSHIDDIEVHEFTERDVVRHKLVQKIIQAYEKSEQAAAQRAAERKNRRAPQPGTRYIRKKD